MHSASEDPPDWQGDAKVAGLGGRVTDAATIENVFRAFGSEPPSEPSHLFRADVTKVVVTLLGEPTYQLVIESWRERRGHRRIERR